MKKDIIHSIVFIINTARIIMIYFVIVFFIVNAMYQYNVPMEDTKTVNEEIIREYPAIHKEVVEEPIVVAATEPKVTVTFNENNLGEVSNITYEDMDKILSNTTMSHLSKAIVDSEKIHGVNAFLTLSIIALESSWATSSRATSSNNLTGMAVYGDDSPGEYYNTQYECVLDTARQLKKHYLSTDGMYYSGLSTKDVNINYSENGNWYNIVNQIAYEMINKHDKLSEGE